MVTLYVYFMYMDLCKCKQFLHFVINKLLFGLADLMYVDVSNNQLDTLPPQIRRLTNLQTLLLNNNPLMHAQIRQLPSLVSLETLHMRGTARTVANFPAGVESLVNLKDLDLSYNELVRVPEALYKLSSLVRLNLSNNEIMELSTLMDTWERLEYLNVSRNKLTELPGSLCKLTSLRKIYLNGNQVDFAGIPASIGKLGNLEVFSASTNNLEMIPEGVCRCGKLKKLILNSNRLITLPDAIHSLTDLEVLIVMFSLCPGLALFWKFFLMPAEWARSISISCIWISVSVNNFCLGRWSVSAVPMTVLMYVFTDGFSVCFSL